MSRKNMRNPMERVDFENPAGDVMQELSENELDKVTGGIDYVSNKNSCGDICTITGECQGTTVTYQSLFPCLNYSCRFGGRYGSSFYKIVGNSRSAIW